MHISSIRHKLILFFSLFITLILGVIAAGTYAYFKQTTEKLILDQQFSTLTSIAAGLDDNISSAHDALINVAKVAPPDSVNNQRLTQQWLENRTGIRTIFSHSLTIFDKSGRLIASVPAEPDLYGTSFAEREYFTRTMSSHKPYISAPFVTAANDRPVVMMTSILHAKDGSIKGLLCGAIELLDQEGLFGTIKNARIGSSGYMYLFAQDRTMILHPDSSRILKQDVMPGANALFDKALDGFEGSGETINSKGQHFLASFKRLQMTGWILAANYPAAEAYQPITQFRNYYLLGMLAVFLASIALARQMGIGITRPLEDFTAHIKSLAQSGTDRSHRLDEQRTDEVGLLAKAFNTLLDEVEHHELELQQATDLADAANKSKSMFLASMSHELRTPMNGVLGMLELVNETELTSGQREYVELAQSSARILLSLLNDILDFSKIEAGKLELEHVKFALRSLLSETLHTFSLPVHDKGLSLDLQIDEQIPYVLMGDPIRLRQIIINLLGNAIKFTRQGRITVEAALENTTVSNVTIAFSVSDSGIGITREQQAVIFDAFTQADTSTTRQFGGTGLGLAICSRLVAMMQGKIRVDSEPGQGSVFRFVVCFDRAEETANELQPAPIPVQTQSRLGILLAEDNPTNQKFAMTVLAKAGHTVMLAKNGEEAVEQAMESRFDVILMDIEMPRLDGFGATQAIRARGIDTPIIALTAHAIQGFRERCLAAGMTDYLTKPIRSRDLLEKLGQFPRQPNASTTKVIEEDKKPVESPVLDTAAALKLMDGDMSILLTLLPFVLEQMSADRIEIATAISNKEADQVKKISHRLKGSVGQIGAVRAHKACALLEAAAANGDSATLVDLQISLNTELDALSPAIKAHIALHTHPDS